MVHMKIIYYIDFYCRKGLIKHVKIWEYSTFWIEDNKVFPSTMPHLPQLFLFNLPLFYLNFPDGLVKWSLTKSSLKTELITIWLSSWWRIFTLPQMLNTSNRKELKILSNNLNDSCTKYQLINLARIHEAGIIFDHHNNIFNSVLNGCIYLYNINTVQLI